MKRPGPLPPPRRSQPDQNAEPDLDGDGTGAERGRNRLASVLPFGRRAAEADDVEDPAAEAGEDHVAPGSGAVGSGRFGIWRAGRRRRRAERAEVRRFTVRSRRRRVIWLSSIGAVVLLAVGTIGAAYSPLFAVQRIDVVGAQDVDPAAIQEAISDQVDRPMPLIDHDEIHAALTSFPRIESYAVEVQPPHDLVVRIVERTAVAVFATDAGFTTVDAAGVALDTTEEHPEGLPLAEVESGPDSDAFRAAGQVLRSLPSDMAERVTAVRATSREDIAFDLPDGGGVTIVWGSAGETSEKVATLTAAFEATPPDQASSYDVSSTGVLVVE
ncbi:hypothetical protein GCM10010915_24160 [Microbacterium faecale]|uniref:POTRA domain-containing protein n=1 Tax=Microbacterium faecale TaxID=1804630 RepID=A0A916YF42_9MICO|nr:FtsQ-type POTRA domain-containing protein [Microbacterium faecale]GGD42237.1 hypothetical protein GCM10010915_24160 [Microbacterium faecale]